MHKNIQNHAEIGRGAHNTTNKLFSENFAQSKLNTLYTVGYSHTGSQNMRPRVVNFPISNTYLLWIVNTILSLNI